MATITLTKPTTTGFPKAEIVSILTSELVAVAKSEADVRNIALPPEPSKIVKMAVPMDSLTVVDALCALEPTLGFELRDSTVRTGGYSSVEAALEHLIPKIERAWVRKKGQKP
jgi:hypothetical protein